MNDWINIKLYNHIQIKLIYIWLYSLFSYVNTVPPAHFFQLVKKRIPRHHDAGGETSTRTRPGQSTQRRTLNAIEASRARTASRFRINASTRSRLARFDDSIDSILIPRNIAALMGAVGPQSGRESQSDGVQMALTFTSWPSA